MVLKKVLRTIFRTNFVDGIVYEKQKTKYYICSMIPEGEGSEIHDISP